MPHLDQISPPDEPATAFSDSRPPRPDGLGSIWLTEALRQIEERTGWLDDQQANRQARAAGGSFGQRLQHRAWLLARRDGLARAQAQWRQGAWLGALGLALLALFSGAGLALAALGAGDGTGVINVYRALGALLGLHLLTLLLWLAGSLLAPGPALAGAAGLAGRLWLRLSGWLSRDARGWQLGPALGEVLRQQRLLRPLFGVFSHGFWLLALSAALVTALLLLSTRRYGFVWESTLLGGDSLAALSHALGWLPARFGFPVLDTAAIQAGGQGVVADSALQRQWALWLVGALVVYGVVPRLLLALGCALLSWRRLGRMALDEQQPGYRLLRSRLVPAGEAVGITDAAPEAMANPCLDAGSATATSGAAVLAAVELAADIDWPPDLPPGVAGGQIHDAGRLDSGGQRQRLLDQLVQAPALRLLVACDPRRSPDRGTLRLLVELAQHAATMRVWLVPAPAGHAVDAERVQDWQAALADARLQTLEGAQALAWLDGAASPQSGVES